MSKRFESVSDTEVRIFNERTGGMKGSKQDDFSLLPWEQLAEVAKLYAFGAEKYDRNNWRKGYDWHLSYASLQRHAAAWWEGDEVDEESGCDHMASVVFHALALMFFRKYHPDLDDRWRTTMGVSVGSHDEANTDRPHPDDRAAGSTTAGR